jgi:hypothetical protein
MEGTVARLFLFPRRGLQFELRPCIGVSSFNSHEAVDFLNDNLGEHHSQGKAAVYARGIVVNKVVNKIVARRLFSSAIMSD